VYRLLNDHVAVPARLLEEHDHADGEHDHADGEHDRADGSTIESEPARWYCNYNPGACVPMVSRWSRSTI
jgi:hypothetical protein